MQVHVIAHDSSRSFRQPSESVLAIIATRSDWLPPHLNHGSAQNTPRARAHTANNPQVRRPPLLLQLPVYVHQFTATASPRKLCLNTIRSHGASPRSAQPPPHSTEENPPCHHETLPCGVMDSPPTPATSASGRHTVCVGPPPAQARQHNSSAGLPCGAVPASCAVPEHSKTHMKTTWEAVPALVPDPCLTAARRPRPRQAHAGDYYNRRLPAMRCAP